MPHVAIYTRISSSSQDARGQEAELARWSAGMTPVPVWYADKASGLTMDRPAWCRLWGDVEAGRVSKIAVWRIDRLGRTVRGLVTLFEELRQRRVGLTSLRDGFDLETPSGRLMAHILASISVFETEIRGERQRAGIEAARARGQHWGGSVKGRRLKVTLEQIEAIERLRREGKAVSAIARATGLSRPTIYRLLSAPR